MITASITIRGRSKKRIEILQTIKGIKDQLGRNTRCKQVKIYQDIDDENTFVVVEDWPTEHDLDEYLSSRLFKVLLGITPFLKDQLEIKLFTEMKKNSLSSRRQRRPEFLQTDRNLSQKGKS